MNDSILEIKIGYSFKNIKLLNQALTHSSFIESENNYEKLEFLGDRVLGLVISDELLKIMPQSNVGDIHLRFESLTNEEYLSGVSKKLGISNYLNVQSGEDGKNFTLKVSILADALEAIIGAIFLDGGFENAKLFIFNNFYITSDLPELNSKSKLQQLVLSKGYDLPIYSLEERKGPDHEPIFFVKVTAFKNKFAFGEGKSHKKAELSAALNFLEQINSTK